MKVTIDPGHGGFDSGSLGCGKKEKDIVLSLSRKIGEKIKAKGVTPMFTRLMDTKVDNPQRPQMAIQNGSDLLVSIHTNWDGSASTKGYEVLYNPNNAQSSAAATAFDSSFKSNSQVYTKRRDMKKRPDLAVLNNSGMPGILLEVGFITNQDDVNIMTKKEDALAEAIATGIVAAIKAKNSPMFVNNTTNSSANGTSAPEYNMEKLDLSGKYSSIGATNSRTTQNSLVSWYKPTVMPPSYYDDTLPAHRVEQGPYYLRLGDCQFYVPPLFISVNNPSATERVPVMRQIESTQKGHGYSAREIEISLWFNDIEQINGFEVESGMDCGNYYMDGLRSLIAQFKKLPFIPIVNELLNQVHMIYAATLLNVSFSTVPQMPGCIQATLILKEFNAMPYLGVPTTCYDSMFCWPLFRWFYQQQLVDGPTYSRYKLPKIATKNLTGGLKFKLLPEAYLNQATADVDPDQNENGQYSYLSKEWLFMEEVDMDYENMSITNIAITLGNMVTDLQLANHQVPTHQYMGSLDTMITVNISTESRKLVNQLVEIHNTTQRYCRDYKNKLATGYMGIENELINMMGVECVTLQNMNVRTVEGHPTLLSVQMDFLSYNKTQHDDSSPRGFTPHAILDENVGMLGKTADQYHKPMIWDGVLEDMAQEIELYPDLNLPVYKEVDDVIAKINAYRKSKGYKDIGITNLTPPVPEKPYFVDPDFYMFYPSPVTLGIIDIEAFDRYWAAYNEGGARGILDQSLKAKTGVDQAHRVMQLIADCQRYSRDYEVPAKFATEESTQGMPPIAEKEVYKFMVHDMMMYSKRYTMCRAFPTAMFFFMDEGPRVNGMRLLNNMYSYNALVSVDVYRDRDNPVDVCELVVANIYNSLSTKPSYYDAKAKSWMGTLFLEVDDEMVAQRKKLFKFMNLEAGARVHVRMGYGSTPSLVPTVFNGMIAEVETGPIMRILCQSDGHELTNVIPSGEESNNGLFSKGNETSDVIGNIMTDRAGWQGAFTWTGVCEKLGDFVNESRYGIEHFGYVYAKEDFASDFKSLFHVGDEGKMSYDAMKNVYKGAPFVEDTGMRQKTTIKKWSLGNPTDEYNVYMYMYGKTSWDVFKALEGVNIEYIVTASPHNFRSTLFFGQPTWLYKCGFKYKGGATQSERMDINNYYEVVKTYSQMHCIDSLSDIIDNGIMASSNGMATAVIPVYVEGEKAKSDFVVFADKNINPEHQKTVYYDTTFMQDFVGFEWMYTAAGASIAERNARLSAISYLRHSLKDMYKGQLIIIGDASIKPYDVLNIQDGFREMFGITYVGAVTHSMSVSEGFVTSIKADLITTTHRAESIGHMRVLSMAQIFTTNYMIARMSMVSTPSLQLAMDMYTERSTGKTIDDRNDVGEVMLKAVGAAGAMMLAPGGFMGAGLVLAGAAGWYIVDKAIEWFQKVFMGRDNHTISILPLMVGSRPYVAGVKGNQTLIPGYSDNADTWQRKFGFEMDEKTAESENLKDIDDFNAITNGVNSRYSTGVNIFSLEHNAAEASDEQLLGWASSNNNALLNFSGTYGGADGDIIEVARKQLGKPYVWGAEGPNSFDCSGFVHYVGKTSGYPYVSGRTTADSMFKGLNGKNLTFSDSSKLQPGDLIFRSDGSKYYHVVIFAGNGKYIGADGTKEKGGKVQEVTYKKQPGDMYAKNPAAFKQASSGSSSSNSEPGLLPTGESYVHVFRNAICSSYHEGAGNPLGHATASGRRVYGNSKIAAAHNMMTGTEIYIPALKYLNGNGRFIVGDTGGPSFDFDINTPKNQSFKDTYDVYVIKWGEDKKGEVMCQSFDSALGNVIHAHGVTSKTYKNVINAMNIDKQQRGGYKTENFVQPGKSKKDYYSRDGKKL